MAIYYFARRLQNSEKRNKPTQQLLKEKELMAPLGNKISEVVVGCVQGPGLGLPSASASSPIQQLQIEEERQDAARGNAAEINTKRTQVLSASSTEKQFQQQLQLQLERKGNAVINHHVLSRNLIFRDGHLVSGTLEGMTDYLIESSGHDPAFTFAFLLCSRIFIRPHLLLGNLFQHAFSNRSDEEALLMVPRVVSLLGEWTTSFPYDFRDGEGLMMANVRGITHKCVSIVPSIKGEVSSLLTSLLEKLTSLEKFESSLAKINLEVQMGSNHGIGEEKFIRTICPSPHLLAQTLTFIEGEKFGFIGPQEFIQAFMKEPSSPGQCKSRIESYVEWFHRLSLAAATDICKRENRRERLLSLEYWVESTSICLTLGNFNSAIAIFTSLGSRPVQRLGKTWSKFRGKDHLSELETSFNPEDNFATYRRNLTKEGSLIIAPFFSLLIKDLFFLKEAAATRLPNGHLNFTSFLQLGRLVGELMGWQRGKRGKLQQQPSNLAHLIQTLPVLNDKALLLASFEAEPPTSEDERIEMETLARDALLTDSFQSLPAIPSTSSGSTSGVHEEEATEDNVTPTFPFLLNPSVLSFVSAMGSLGLADGTSGSSGSGTGSSASASASGSGNGNTNIGSNGNVNVGGVPTRTEKPPPPPPPL